MVKYMLVLLLSSSLFSNTVADVQPVSVDPISLLIRAERGKYLVGEPVIVTIELKNVSSEEIVLPGFVVSNLSFGVTTPNGETVLTGTGTSYFRSILPPFVTIKPSESVLTRLNILDTRLVKDPGTYTVKAVFDTGWYGGEKSPQVWVGKATSQAVNIEIVEPESEKDKEVVRLLIEKEPDLRFVYATNPELCLQIMKEYPDSSYAKYALFYLARGYEQQEPMPGVSSLDEGVLKARDIYVQILKQYPDFELTSDVHLGLAKTYALMGNRETLSRAKEEAEAIIRDFPETYAAQQAEKLLIGIEALMPSTEY